MRTLLCSAFAVFFAVAVTQQAAAQDRQITASAAGTQITFVVPSTFCPLDPNQPADARMLGVLRQSQAGKNEVLAQFANCEQLVAWRSGQRKVLDDMGGVTTPLQYLNQTLTYSRTQLVQQLAEIYKNQGGALLQGATDDVNKAIGSAAKSIRINETKFLGVLHQDETAVYIGILQGLRTEFGDTKVQIGVTGITMLKGKMVSISIYTPAVSDMSSSEALATARGIVEKTVAANGG